MKITDANKQITITEYVDPNGTKGILVGSPSPDSWKQFVRILLDIKSKYDIQ